MRTAANGELQIRGPIVMLGYWNNPAATDAVLDKDGWFHTGDVVEIREGRIYIRGRVKDIIVMSNGEKVPPGDVEAAILRDPVFEQVMLIGEGRPKLACWRYPRLVTRINWSSEPMPSSKVFPGYARICGVIRTAEPWTVDNGILTPTLKIKRPVVESRFAAEIGVLYTRQNGRCS